MKFPIKSQKQCPKCQGKGLLPFVKEGKVIPHTFLFCESHPQYGSEVYDQTPDRVPVDGVGKRPLLAKPSTIPKGRMRLYIDDFDFPMSYDYYRSLCQYHGWPNPGSDRVTEQASSPLDQVIVHRHSNMSRQEADMLQQAVLKIGWLEKKLAEREKKTKEKESGYY